MLRSLPRSGGDALGAALERASVDLSALRGVERNCDIKSEDTAARDRSYAVRLLRDVLAVLHEGETFVPSAVLLDRLHGLAKAPWRVFQRSGLTAQTLAQLLGAHGVESKVGQTGKGRKDRKTAHGYHVRDLKAVKL